MVFRLIYTIRLIFSNLVNHLFTKRVEEIVNTRYGLMKGGKHYDQKSN